MQQVLSHWCSYQVICVHQVLSHWGCDWTQALFRFKKKNLLGTSPKSSEPTYLHCITVQYSRLHYSTLHYSKEQYITLHYSTLQYSTLQCITLHTCIGFRTWCTKSYVTKAAQVQSHQNLHTCSTLQYSTEHYITIHNTLNKNI